jgi:hypothetical protein
VHPTRQQLDELDALLQRMLALPVSSVEEEVSTETTVRKPDRAPTETPRPPQEGIDRFESHEAAPSPPPDAAEDDEAWVPLRSSWQPSAQTWGPLAKQWQEARHAAQSQPTVRRPEPEPEPAGAGRYTSARTEPVPGEPVARKEPAGPPELPTSWHVDARANEPLEPLPSLKALLPPLPAPPAPKPVEPTRSAEPPLSPLWWPCAAITAIVDFCLSLMGPFGLLLRGPAGKSLLGVVGLLCLAGAVVLSAIDWFGWTW